MNWDNYGTYWEIDHIKPLCQFPATTESVKVVWNLNNLQPLECKYNRSKGGREEYRMDSKQRYDDNALNLSKDGSVSNKEFLLNQERTESKDFDLIYTRLKDVDSIRILHSSLGLVTEAGEFADATKKYIFYGKKFDTINLIEELGDLFYYMALACNVLGVSFEEVMQINANKLKKRFPEKFEEQLAINRNVDSERKILEGKND